MDVDTVNSILCHPVNENGHRVHDMVVSSAVEYSINVTAMHAKASGKQSSVNLFSC